MRSGSGRSLASLGSKGDTNSVSESTASGGVEVGKEAKEKKDKSSWVKTIGMRTLRLRKNKDPEKSQSRLSIASALGSLERPGKSKSKKAEKQVKGEDEQAQQPGAGASASAPGASKKAGDHVKDNGTYSGASTKNGSATREAARGSTSAAAGENTGTLLYPSFYSSLVSSSTHARRVMPQFHPTFMDSMLRCEENFYGRKW